MSARPSNLRRGAAALRAANRRRHRAVPSPPVVRHGGPTAISCAPEADGLARVGATPPLPSAVVMVPLERLEELVRLVSESAVGAPAGRADAERQVRRRTRASFAEFNELSRSLNVLQDRVMRTQMVPVATITDQPAPGGPRSRPQPRARTSDGRSAGTDTELDRGVLHQLSDSLLHLVRNAVDHGIEHPTSALAAGKPAQATIRLHAMQLGSEVIIAVSDDGRGIDIDRVRAARPTGTGIDTAGLSEDEIART